jgi:hypothetical protein
MQIYNNNLNMLKKTKNLVVFKLRIKSKMKVNRFDYMLKKHLYMAKNTIF